MVKLCFLAICLYDALVASVFSANERNAVAGVGTIVKKFPGVLVIKFVDADGEVYGASWDLRRCGIEGDCIWKTVYQLFPLISTNKPCHAAQSFTLSMQKLQQHLEFGDSVSELHDLPVLKASHAASFFPGNAPVRWTFNYVDEILDKRIPGSLSVSPHSSDYCVQFVPCEPECGAAPGGRAQTRKGVMFSPETMDWLAGEFNLLRLDLRENAAALERLRREMTPPPPGYHTLEDQSFFVNVRQWFGF